MKDDLIKILKENNVVDKSKYILKSGKVVDFYVDIKKAYGNPKAVNLICDALWPKLDKNVTCIATSGLGGITPASVLSTRYNLNLTMVRDKPKKWGRNTWIEGYVPNKTDKIAIIDDVFTTGGSLRKIIEVLKPTGADILGCYVVVKRGEGELPVAFKYLMTADELF
ncbi:MAG: hypothetical protein KKF46_01590 [Nanoarchaeota archaeon]|nr:hypothetical protein [Nanoarchaeota archaeon]MBU1321024.1 hypothetical protein [Nanoarchaeota archaeon]MBU1598438.1 hypothetical protein [Nanoarchaeota archaeon]MBU2441364.1 hypothetical protein [Nanoarchaeota archaeon]